MAVAWAMYSFLLMMFLTQIQKTQSLRTIIWHWLCDYLQHRQAFWLVDPTTRIQLTEERGEKISKLTSTWVYEGILNLQAQCKRGQKVAQQNSLTGMCATVSPTFAVGVAMYKRKLHLETPQKALAWFLIFIINKLKNWTIVEDADRVLQTWECFVDIHNQNRT